MSDQPTALDIALQARDAWERLFYWAVGGLAGGFVALGIYLKGIIAEVSASRVKSAEGDLAQAKSNEVVAAALNGLAEEVRDGR